MNLNEINFSFDGQHCMRDFGLMYVEDNGHPITPDTQRNEYEIAGMSGSLLMPGYIKKTKTFSGKLYFVTSPASQAEAQENLRRIATWLTAGRGQLIFDYEPDRYYIAQVDSGMDWDFGEWIDGGLSVDFKAQPFAFSKNESIAQAQTALTSVDISLALDSGLPAPIRIEIENTGGAVITAFGASLNGKHLTFAGLALATGETLSISLEAPISAVYSAGGSALDKATALPQLMATPGGNVISLTIGYGAGAKGAKVTAAARGRV